MQVNEVVSHRSLGRMQANKVFGNLNRHRVLQPPEVLDGAAAHRARKVLLMQRHHVFPAIIWYMLQFCNIPPEALHMIADLVMGPDAIYVGIHIDLTLPSPITYYQSDIDGVAVRRTDRGWTEYKENGANICDLTEDGANVFDLTMGD